MRTILISMALMSLLPLSARAAPSPRQVIESSAESVKEVLRQKTAKGSREEQDQKARLRKVVDGFLDFAELAKRALGAHWEPRTEQERTEFVQLLRDLIEAAYANAIRQNVDFTLRIDEEQLAEDGATASVVAVASAQTKKKKTVSEDLVFHLFLQNGRWMIYDVEFGDVSLVRHYRSEFNRKIKKESYPALVAAMKKKLDEVKSGKVSEKDTGIR
jgi:phospholipid transport system substrate-binding protein